MLKTSTLAIATILVVSSSMLSSALAVESAEGIRLLEPKSSRNDTLMMVSPARARVLGRTGISIASHAGKTADGFVEWYQVWPARPAQTSTRHNGVDRHSVWLGEQSQWIHTDQSQLRQKWNECYRYANAYAKQMHAINDKAVPYRRALQMPLTKSQRHHYLKEWHKLNDAFNKVKEYRDAEVAFMNQVRPGYTMR